ERLREVKPSTVRRQLAIIKHAFEIARDEWGIPLANALAKMRIKGDTKRNRRLRPGEFDKLIKATTACRNTLVLPIIRLAPAPGMRRGEILAIRQKDVDFNNRALLIPETKTGHRRTIPLSK